MMVMVLLPVSGHAEGSQCCHLLLCDTTVPFTGWALGCPCHVLLFGFWEAPGNYADLPYPWAGLPPTFCFISSPSSPSPFSFLTLFFLTDKRILNEPKSHRKFSFHGHFFVCFFGFVLLKSW